MLLVVFGHAFGGVRDAHLLPPDGVLATVFYVIYTFHMSAFFFLSGLFVAPRVEKAPRAFFASIPANLIWPYLLWGCILVLVQTLAGNYTNANLGPLRPGPFLSVVYAPPGPFWYIYILIFYHLLAAAFIRLRATIWTVVVGVALFILGGILIKHLLDPPFFGLHFFLFYALGVIAGCKPALLSAPTRFDNVFVALGLMVFAVALALWGQYSHLSYYDVRLLPAALAGSAGIFMLARTLGARGAWLAYIGKRSLPIYVMHVVFTAGARIIMVKLIGNEHPLLILAAAYVAGLGAPLIAYEITVRLKLTAWAGFGVSRPTKKAEIPA